MKKIILIILCCLSFNMLNAQNLNFPNWLLQGNMNIEQHDKRGFGYPDQAYFQEIQPEDWGTYHYRLTVNRKVFSHWKLTTYMGLGLNYERATWIRPFDHSYFDEDDWTRILRFLNSYKKIQLQTPIQFYYTLTGKLLLKLEGFANWRFYRKIPPYTEYKFEFESMELLSGLSLKLDKTMFGIDVRVFNFQKIDRVIADSSYRQNKKMELHNPLLFQFSVGYFFGGGAQKPTLR